MKTNSYDQDVGILVIDDHAISRHFTYEALRQFSNNIRQARTGHEAISTTRSWFPGLIYTDIHLPDTCGLSLVQKIRSAWPQERNLPHVIVITGDSSPRLMQRAKQADIAGILLKPVRMDDIRASAQQLIQLDSNVRESPMKDPGAAIDQELRELFSRELNTRLPALDGFISQLDWLPAGEILHQLIASSAMCREKELENCSRLLHQAISTNPEPKTIAQAYHPFLRAAAQTKMHF
jgi:two-component system chemotaxis response regulator CheY